MSDRVKLRCQACGDAENCNFYCELIIAKNIVEDMLFCPISGDECEWNEVEDMQAERIKELETELEKHRWIPVSEKLPEESCCLVLCEGKVYEVKVRVSNDEWEDEEGKSSLKLTAKCDIEHLGCILIGHDVCITHWKPIIVP